MNEKKKLQPKVRFREFTGENAPDWEQRKLGEVADIIGGGTPDTSNPNYWNGNIDWYSPVEIGNNIYISDSIKKITELGLQKSSAKLLPIGTVLFTSRAGIGNTAILSKEGCTNQGFQSIIPHQGILNSYFIFSKTAELKKYGERVGAGSTFVEVSGKQMRKMSICIPSYVEQQRIGHFFETLDKLITLHQRKLEQLEQLKNTLLSKMFPKSGTNIPEIRFSGFTDAWKQRKLEEIIVKEIKGKAKSENISTNFANKGSLYLDTEYLNGGKPKYVSLPSDTDENDIIILWDGSQAGKLYKGVVGALGSTLKAYKIPEHTLFYYYQMLGSQEKIYNQYRTPNIPHVVKSFTSEFMIWDTSNDEKTLIIDIYSNLFNYIAIHQRKLDQLKNLKQTLLNKMFI